MHAALQYESEKSPRRVSGGGAGGVDRSRDGGDWSRGGGDRSRGCSGRARLDTPDECRSTAVRVRPTVICDQMHETKPTVPLRVWVLASASCFAVCAALVLATVAITKWGSGGGELYPEPPPPPPPPYPRTGHDRYQSHKKAIPKTEKLVETGSETDEISNSILEKLSMFKSFINRDNKKDSQKSSLIHKPQYHPEFDPSITHSERKIEKKAQADHNETGSATFDDLTIPEFKPTLPDIFVNHSGIKLPDGYVEGLRKYDQDYYSNDLFYQDDPLYDDYVESNSMTNYLIEKIQELYEWVTMDPELEGVKNSTDKIFRKKGDNSSHNEFGQLLLALNESIIEGNATIVMLKLKDLYFGAENFTNLKAAQRIILKNTTDLLSFGMLTLDVMLLHHIQLMAWESQESTGLKMLQDPEVFAFNAMFMDPTKIESKRQEVLSYKEGTPMHARRQDATAVESESRSLLESVLELGLSAARAALHLGRAYKSAKSTLKQISGREATMQSHLARNSQSNARALTHLRASYGRGDAHIGGHHLTAVQDGGGGALTEAQDGRFTELDCVWFLYCRNLVATAKLSSPFGTMARINGVALRMIAGELAADKALDTLLVEATSGWTELRCQRMLPRCSHGDAATVVLESIVQSHRKGHLVDHHKKP